MQQRRTNSKKINTAWQGNAANRHAFSTRRMQPELPALDTINPCYIINYPIISIQREPFKMIGRISSIEIPFIF